MQPSEMRAEGKSLVFNSLRIDASHGNVHLWIEESRKRTVVSQFKVERRVERCAMPIIPG